MKDQPVFANWRQVTSGTSSQILVETPAGQKITLQDNPAVILVEDANGNSVRLDASGITVKAAAKVLVVASIVEISAAEVNVNAGMAKFSGVLQADTLIATHLINPGSGNVW